LVKLHAFRHVLDGLTNVVPYNTVVTILHGRMFQRNQQKLPENNKRLSKNVLTS